MASWKHTLVFIHLWSLYLSPAVANQIQFYNPSTNNGLALSSAFLDNGTTILMQLTAPASYGWAAVGTGSMMDNSLMFFIYPSSDDKDNALTLSVRIAKGHNEPQHFKTNTSTMSANLTSGTLADGIMTANIALHLPTHTLDSRLDPAYHAQAFIWAVGPKNSSISSSDPSHKLQEHSTKGVFFADMPQAQNPQESLPAPSITGTKNMGVRAQPQAYHLLVLIHATLLAGAFVLVFPMGVITLRLVSRLGTKLHIFLQLFAAVAVACGVAVAVTLSIIGIEYAHLTHPHQIVGLSVAVLVGLQVFLGQAHHVRYKLLKKRTWYSFAHMGVGRVVIYGGMVNAVLGLWLCNRKLPMLVAGGVSGVVVFVLEFVAIRAHIRRGRTGRAEGGGWGSKSEYHKLKDVTVAEREVRAEYETNYGRVGQQRHFSGGHRYEGFRHART